jgi:hypothetical protein
MFRRIARRTLQSKVSSTRPIRYRGSHNAGGRIDLIPGKSANNERWATLPLDQRAGE